MKRFTSLFVLLFTGFCLFQLAACGSTGSTGSTGQSTLGNGKVDPTEAAALRVAVGLAFTARPDTIAPSYAVSTAILAGLDVAGGQAVPLSAIDGLIGQETAKLKLDPLTQQSFNDLILLVKAKVLEQLSTNTDVAARMVVVRDLVTIVQQTAAARLGMAPAVTPVAPAPAVPPAPESKG